MHGRSRRRSRCRSTTTFPESEPAVLRGAVCSASTAASTVNCSSGMSPVSGASSQTAPSPSPTQRLIPAYSRENHSTVGWITARVAAGFVPPRRATGGTTGMLMGRIVLLPECEAQLDVDQFIDPRAHVNDRVVVRDRVVGEQGPPQRGTAAGWSGAVETDTGRFTPAAAQAVAVVPCGSTRSPPLKCDQRRLRVILEILSSCSDATATRSSECLKEKRPWPRTTRNSTSPTWSA